MPFEQFGDVPYGAVSSGGTTAPAPGTSQSWTVTTTSVNPFPGASNSMIPPTAFHVADPALPSETIVVTNVSGTAWTVTRGVDGTAPVAHATGFTIYQVVSAGALGMFPQVYNVRSVTYGATGNGSTDDTAAIEAALTAAGSAGGGRVHIPAGTYKITPPSATVPALTVPSNVTISGDGIGATTLVKNGNGILLDYSGTGPASETGGNATSVYQGLRDIAINGNSFTGLLLRLYYVQNYVEENVFLYGNGDVFVDMTQCWDSRIMNSEYLYGGSSSASALTAPITTANGVGNSQAVVHLIRNSAAPATTLTTALTSGVSSTGTLHVAALPAALPAGIVQVWNASFQVQNFVTTGAANGATTIPVTAQTANATYPIGSAVNGFGWSGDSSNSLTFEACHWENNLSGAIWITKGINSGGGDVNNVFITNTKVEQDVIGYNCPIIEVDSGGNIQINTMQFFPGGFNGGFSTAVTGFYWHPNYGYITGVDMENGGSATISSGFDVNPGTTTTLLDIFEYWNVSPTVAGVSFTGGVTAVTGLRIGGTVTTPVAVSGGATYGPGVPSDTGLVYAGQPNVQQSATAQTVAAGNTITTANLGAARVTATGATGTLILQAGTVAGQTITVINESAFTLTFNTAGTSHVADGASDAILTLTARTFTWDAGTSLWYRSA